MPLVKVTSGALPGDNTESIRLHPDEDGSERSIVVGGDAVEVSGDELQSLASNFSVEVLDDLSPLPSSEKSPAPSPIASQSTPSSASSSSGSGA